MKASYLGVGDRTIRYEQEEEISKLLGRLFGQGAEGRQLMPVPGLVRSDIYVKVQRANNLCTYIQY